MITIGNKVNRNVLVSCDHGLMIVNRFDCNHENVGHGQWLLDHGNTSTVEAQSTYESIKDIENPVIFDVGANIGTYTTWMAKLFPDGKVYCFEPQRSVFQMLCGNIAINNLYNCYTYNIAIGNADEPLLLQEPDYFQSNDFGTFSLIEDKISNKSGVKIITDVLKLDTFFEKYQLERVDLIKIDVEGMDIDVLKGAQNIIKKYNPVIFIEHSDNRRSILETIIEYLGIDNYHFNVIGNNLLAKPIK
jgi:FkbM family methyltransferase